MLMLWANTKLRSVSEVLMPFAQQESRILVNQVLDPSNIGTIESSAFRKPDWLQPKLSFTGVTT